MPTSHSPLTDWKDSPNLGVLGGHQDGPDLRTRPPGGLIGHPARDYGSKGWGFESLRARPGQRPVPIAGTGLFYALHREITAQGWTGSVQAVEHYVRQFRGADGRSRAGRNPLQAPPAAPPPKTREVTRWLLTHPNNLDPADQARLDAATARCPHLDDLARHVRAFAKIMARRQGLLELEDWLTGAEASDVPQLRSFARGIRRDQQAVTAGLSLPYSSAALEGNVSKIKLIKRQMFGRAGFPLLRKRVIHHPA